MKIPLLLMLAAMFMLVLGYSTVAWSAHPIPPNPYNPSSVKLAQKYIEDFHESWCKPDMRKRCVQSIQHTARWKDAGRLARLIVETAEEYGITFIELLVIVQFESSFSPKAIGELNEVGLGQLYGVSARGFDLSTAEGQLAGTANWYATGLEECNGCRLRALNYYQSGRCITAVKGAARRLTVIRRLEEELSLRL